MNRRTLLASFLVAPVAAVFSRREAFGETASLPAGPRAGYFPDVVLWTQENKTVRFYDDLIKGKIVLINFMYATCKGLCPRQTANLVQVQRVLDRKSTRLNSSHLVISYAVFCLKKKKIKTLIR